MKRYNNNFPWKTISSKKIYKNKWLQLREDKIILPSGERGIYGVVEISPAVGIIPVTNLGELILVELWRYPARKKSIEIPLGGVEKGEKILTAAKRELFEETGYKAKNWKFLGIFESSNCLTTDKAYLYKAGGLYKVKKNRDDKEILKLIKIPIKKAVSWVKSDKITESISKGAILLLDKDKA